MDQTASEKKQRARSPKVEFVLAQPPEMKAAELSNKAKEAGLEITPGYVCTIRSSAGLTGKPAGKKTPASKATKAKKGSAAARTTKKSSPKKAMTPATRKGRGGDKKAFILAQPASLSNAEVIAAAKRAGMSISSKHVRNVRDAAGIVVAKKPARVVKKAAVKAPAKKALARKAVTNKAGAQPRKQTKVRPAPAPSPVNAATPEILFRKLVLELGLTRSRELLVEVERKLAELIAGE